MRAEAALPPRAADEVVTLVRAMVFTKYGTDQESAVLARLQQLGSHNLLALERKYFKQDMGSAGGFSWSLSGQVDALTADSVIEVKNRTRGLFHQVHTYEWVQLQCYMRLTGQGLERQDRVR